MLNGRKLAVVSARVPPGPSLICYRHETDKSDNRIIGPKLIEPIRIELTSQPYDRWSSFLMLNGRKLVVVRRTMGTLCAVSKQRRSRM